MNISLLKFVVHVYQNISFKEINFMLNGFRPRRPLTEFQLVNIHCKIYF